MILHDWTTYVFAGMLVGAGLGGVYYWEHYDTVRFEQPHERQFNEPEIMQGVWRLGHLTDTIEQGMYVVFKHGALQSVARVVAVEGQRVQVTEKQILVDGNPYEPHGVKAGTTSICETPEMVVPRHCVFVVVDQRWRGGSQDDDSRNLGPISLDAVTHAFRWKEKSKN